MKNLLKNIILFLIFFNPVICCSQNLSWEWTKGFGGTQSESGTKIVADKNKNLYVTGYFEGDSLRLGSYKLTKPGAHLRAIFVAKLDSSGNVIWAKTASGEAKSNSIIIDKHNNVFIGGSFYSSLTFGNGINLNGYYDIFIAKYDENGNIIWAKKAGGSQTDYCAALSIDTLDNIYSTGIIGSSTTAYFDNIQLQNANTQQDVYIAKYTNSGNVLWARNYGDACTIEVADIKCEPSGSFYITGNFFNSDVYFDTITVSNMAGIDGYIVKFDSSGHAIWAKNISGQSNEYGSRLAVDKLMNVYLCGHYFSPTLNIGGISLTNSGQSDGFIVSYDREGNVNWAHKMGGSQLDFGNGITSDEGSNVYVTTLFNSPTIQLGTLTYTNNGIYNIAVSKYDATGNFIGAISGGGNSTDVLSCSDIVKNTLYFYGNINSGQTIYGNSSYTNRGGSDVLLSKLDLGHTCNTKSSLLKYSCGVDSMISPSGNHIYYNTGVYYDTIPNVNNCDSIITVLFVKYSINKIISSTYYPFVNGYLLESNEYAAENYQWVNCLNWNPLSGGTPPSSAFVTNTGNYSVIITKNGCKDTANCALVCFPTYTNLNVSTCSSYTVPSGASVYTVSGFYTDTLQTFFGCDSLVHINLNIIPSNAVASYSASFNSMDSLSLDVTNLSSGNVVSVLWDFGDGQTSTLLNTQHIYSALGHYKICLTVWDENACQSVFCDSTTNVLRYTGINKVNVTSLVTGMTQWHLNNTLALTPNPSSSELTVRSSVDIEKIEIINLTGQVVLSETASSKQSKVYLENISNGVYFVKVLSSDKQTSIKKLVVQK